MILSWDGLDNIIILNCDNKEEFMKYLKYIYETGEWKITNLIRYDKEEIKESKKYDENTSDC